jgi:hypothetical protein
MSTNATQPRESGDLDRCAYCRARLRVVDGTDPNDADREFVERYKCKRGHHGRYKYDHGSEEYYGACRAPS